jgi:type IV secretion system protein VirB9
MVLLSCKTVDFQEINTADAVPVTAEDEQADKEEEKQFLAEQLMQETDIAQTVIHLEPPEIRYSSALYSALENTGNTLTGSDALKQHVSDTTVLPEYENGRLKGWVYKQDTIYEVHCQTYHSTMIQFEPGEEMLETPYISEPDVWRMARGIGLTNGIPTQHLILKPDFIKLTSSLIIITNRRIYHLELKSYNDHYMPIVRWIYPHSITDSESWTHRQNERQLVNEFSGVNPEFLSFDYRMKHSVFNKPLWLPVQVYDDGYKTYIVLDEQTIHMELPLLFNEKNKIINYRTQRNILITDQLIEKATLRLGNQKVVIEKKKTQTETETASPSTAEDENGK